ncbi:MAG: hypothetical protein EA383_11875 [Spirochaetaceae bacterium]|nr:MAG: hypothetical protein EA383_11875 [Spirochaetaceae bacterium]
MSLITRYYTRLLIIVSLIFAVFSACTGSAPTISSVRNALVLYHGAETNTIDYRLSVFAQVSDEDGYEDLAEWVLTDAENRFTWRIPADMLEIRRSEDGRMWFGSTTLAFPYGTDPVFGTYELRVRDLAGLTAETRFDVFSLDYAEARSLIENIGPTPLASRIELASDRIELRVYGNDGSLIDRVRSSEGVIEAARIQSLAEVADAGSVFFLYAYIERSDLWIVSGPHRMD